MYTTDSNPGSLQGLPGSQHTLHPHLLDATCSAHLDQVHAAHLADPHQARLSPAHPHRQSPTCSDSSEDTLPGCDVTATMTTVPTAYCETLYCPTSGSPYPGHHDNQQDYPYAQQRRSPVTMATGGPLGLPPHESLPYYPPEAGYPEGHYASPVTSSQGLMTSHEEQYSPQFSSPDSGYHEGVVYTPCVPYEGYPYREGYDFGQGYAQAPYSKPKRKRVITATQRRQANVRERKRMYTLNESFDRLRKIVPTFSYERKLSRIETLRLAITYIKFMQEVVEGKDPTDVELPRPSRDVINMHRVLQETLGSCQTAASCQSAASCPSTASSQSGHSACPSDQE